MLHYILLTCFNKNLKLGPNSIAYFYFPAPFYILLAATATMQYLASALVGNDRWAINAALVISIGADGT